MTPREALSQITANFKWYAVRPEPEHQIKMRVTAFRILNGTVREDTMREFFSLFGYDVQVETRIKVEKVA